MSSSADDRKSESAPARGSVGDFVLGGISLILGIAIYVLIPFQVNVEPIPGASQYVSFTPAALPRACAIGFMAIGLIQLYLGFSPEIWGRMRAAVANASGRLRKLLGVCVLLPIYPFLMTQVGYFAATVPFLAILAVLGGERRPVTIIMFSLAMPLAIFGLFSSLMSIPLPEGRLLGY